MSAKRKREASFASDPSVPPPSAQAINPHSHPPAKLAQFAVAGLSNADEDPGQNIKDFPHRGFGHKPTEPALESDYETAWEDDTEDGDGQTEAQTAKPKRAPDAQRKHLAVLTRSIHQFLGQGDVTKAARAFGLALQLRPYYRPMDIRRDDLWALGAEIIMREGEEQRNEMSQNQNTSEYNDDGVETGAREGFRIPLRWGSAANMNKLRAYLETLVQQYPYDYRSPKKISALHFNISLYSCEIYNIYIEHTAGLAGTGTSTDESLIDDSLVDEDSEMRLETLVEDESFHATRGRRREESSHPKDKVRQQTLAAIKAVVARLDALMREMPYTKNHELLRLRATASLFMADLAVPLDKTAHPDLHNVEEERRRDIEVAKQALRLILATGGSLDEVSQALTESDDADESLPIEAQIYSVLPIRKA
ncbi:hypothetical protein NLG97_g1320 [Lecanicillium saksenae]|uniref:Uncharacterized protein n=1 Tax=Lecanicillium saksenae TaxID=468837 RepID=A0ACC1R5V1_9HYPO|nr:hypothetical protein NLG97_g1320 [Lecanicillium saksenae]